MSRIIHDDYCGTTWTRVDVWSPIPHYVSESWEERDAEGDQVSYVTRMRRLDSHPDGATDWFRAP